MMALMIVRYDEGAGPRWAVLTGDAPEGPVDRVEGRGIASGAKTLGELIGAIEAAPDLTATGEAVRFAASALLSPVTPDATLICQGLNYDEHAAEAGHHVRKENLLFAKASSSLCGAYADIVRPKGVELLDYEVEVGIVLRRPLEAGTTVTAGNLGSYLAGVVLCNDVSARDTMFGASFMQWFQGKSYRTFCPAGPVFYLLEPEEVAATVDNLELSLTYDGKVRQSANTGQLIYKPAETLTQIAAIMDLKPGDMVLTGTPGGVIAQGTPGLIELLKTNLLNDAARRDGMRVEMKTLGRFLQPGDELNLTLRDGVSGMSLGGQRSRITGA
ncbi:fumarylacetoacetate hydrolase family protein [Sphingobium fuliginis ATCC 27551]|uniref:Fumarylacetoacetate hydrolase family protein n=2 Tax=Sphingobium fuliginis (strain ATCC 27551) TaxID=336203 RepID=A0A5B8CJ89_SPHSA|nr:fumarylacetoacetate hydrolase family protein [Sphingobium sp. PNB]MCB4861521.1 fumarylacetoacetate hydrolase family protein [Sphingobium sp. PNB]QDC39413.1 fumarylacetoacetate hydrolase family protein [Sphingobium fuliginis ATCC 27551]